MSNGTKSNKGTGDVAGGMHEDSVKRVLHEHLSASPTNPRKHFAPGPLRELAENILALARRALANGTSELGVQQPLFARAILNDATKLEIIAGERRWRGTELAMELAQDVPDAPQVIERLMIMPVLLKDWSDEEVIEFQLIENLRRDDLTPLEEADGYQRMIAMGNTAEQISDKVGTSIDQVRKALKWTRLPELARLAFERKIIGKEHATLIARIPDDYERRVATILVLEDNNYREEVDDDEKGLDKREAELKRRMEGGEIEAMSMRVLRELLAEDFMASLSDAAFDQADAELMPVRFDSEGERQCGGACTDCPFKTGNSPLFSSEVISTGGTGSGRSRGIDGNVCTRPSCKTQKTELQWSRDVANAEKQCFKVIDEKEGKGIFYEGTARMAYGSKYVALDEKPDYSLTGHANHSKVQTWEKLLKDTSVTPVIARDGTGKTRRLVPKEVAVLAVNEKYAEKGKDTPLAGASDSRVSEDKLKDEQRKRVEEEKRAKRVFGIALSELLKAASNTSPSLEAWRWMASMALHEIGMDGLRLLAAGLEVKPLEAKKGEQLNQGHYAGALAAALAGEGSTLATLQAVVFVSLAAGEAWRGLDSVKLKEACAFYDVSLVAAKVQARDEAKQKKQAKAAKSPLKPGQKGDTTGMFDRGQSAAKLKDIEAKAAEQETVYEETAFHCDGCGKVCKVGVDRAVDVQEMKPGEFKCSECDDASDYEPVANQTAYEAWQPKAKPVRAAKAVKPAPKKRAAKQATKGKAKK